ncbi:MAG: methionine adenosyltransferase [Hyphomicrobium sp.]
MSIIIDQLTDMSPDSRAVEIVERKGLGHPDTICDNISETFSVALSQYYLKEFGLIFHHNVDKVLLSAGQSRAEFGAGKILKPIELYLSGRATALVEGRTIPLADIAQKTVLSWFENNLHAFDAKNCLRIHTITQPGSSELVSLFMRQKEKGTYLSNDTSCGVGFAPASELERLVLAVERKLNAKEFKAHFPEAGEDIKVMGFRVKDQMTLTLACAFISRYLKSLKDYKKAKEALYEESLALCKQITKKEVRLSINSGDDLDIGDIYLTVSGTSAEAGDDGETGRGNRMNGLITPMRPMCLEAVAGKNPITHVGKLYTAAASKIAHAVVGEVQGVMSAECYLVSQIGVPIHEPSCAHVRVQFPEKRIPTDIQRKVEDITQREIADIPNLWKAFLAQEITVA